LPKGARCRWHHEARLRSTDSRKSPAPNQFIFPDNATMKGAIVRARIEADLKVRAGEVLAANGLELSDAIRLFLRQMVLKGGLPFHVRAPRVKVAPAEKLWQMKRASQARDRAVAAKMELSDGQMLLVPPEEVREARVKWPNAKLSD